MNDTSPQTLTPQWQMPRLQPENRWVGGLADAIARELGVQPIVIRASFAILTLAGGWGLVLYGVGWIAVTSRQPKTPAIASQPKGAGAVERHVAIGLIVVGLVLAFRAVGFGFIDQIVFPLGFAITGFGIAWSHRQDEGGLSAVVRILIGVFLGLGGMIAFLAISSRLVDAVLILAVAAVVLAGMSLVAAPSLAKIGTDLDNERQDRVRADERAKVAAHLHDSVLQTLALIQRHADDPARTSQLARRQERELRHWLYRSADDIAAPGTVRLKQALEAMSAEVDEAHDVPVGVIAVGDSIDLAGPGIESLVAASREAVVNAAKHSGADQIDVFAERHKDRIEIFVRDTGCGFDPDDTAADRKGISQSIVKRMKRVGGDATIHSSVGQGTEVELVLPFE